MLPDRLPNQGIVQTDQKSVDDRALNNSPILVQLLDKISSLSSTVDKLNERMTSLESAPVKDSDNMVAKQENASCPEPTDVSDQLCCCPTGPRDRKLRSSNPGPQFWPQSWQHIEQIAHPRS